MIKSKKIRISFMNMDEVLLTRTEGMATNGSINIDGASAVRRTCQLNFISDELKPVNYFELYKTKFLLEIDFGNGFKKQGIYLLTNFSSNISTNNYTFNISGKDKMCLLNGEHGGSFPFSIDVGKKEKFEYNFEPLVTFEYEPGKYYYQNEGEYILDYSPYGTSDKTYYKRLITSQKEKLTIKEIINNIVVVYGKEQKHNIFINDLEIKGLELLEYRGPDPLYLFRDASSGKIVEITIDGDFDIGNGLTPNTLPLNRFFSTSALKPVNYEPLEFQYSEAPSSYCNIIRIQYGESIGYRDTDLTYAGELTANINENVVSILDKIKNMLGNYEYFYDEEGRFIFQKRQDYTSNQFSSIGIDGLGMEYQQVPIMVSSPIDLTKVASIGQNPQFQNIKNDFSIWGTRSGESGSLPIHSRIAIHQKPEKYVTYEGIEYSVNTEQDQLLYDKKLLQENRLKEILNTQIKISKIYSQDFFKNAQTQEYFSQFLADSETVASEAGTKIFYMSLAWVNAVDLLLNCIQDIYHYEYVELSRSVSMRDAYWALASELLSLRSILSYSSWFIRDEKGEITGTEGLGELCCKILEDNRVTFSIEGRKKAVSLFEMAAPDRTINNFSFFYWFLGQDEETMETSIFSGQFDQCFASLLREEEKYNSNPLEYLNIQERLELSMTYEGLKGLIDQKNLNWYSKLCDTLNIVFLTNMEGCSRQDEYNQKFFINHMFIKRNYNDQLDIPDTGSLYFDLFTYELIYNDSGVVIAVKFINRIPSKKECVTELLKSSMNQIESWQNNFIENYNNLIDNKKIRVSDWREVLYQMAKDYYNNGTQPDFWNVINVNNNNQYLSWKTGYEAFYEDILGFWRQLYYDPLYEPLDYELPVGYKLEDYWWDEGDSRNRWHRDVFDNPSGLNFWIDFIEPQGELSAYAIDEIGVKGKYENSSTVKSIATKNPPALKVLTNMEWELLGENPDPNYTYVQLEGILANSYTQSAQGISALEHTQNLLFNHTYLQESVTLSIVPNENLTVNSRVKLNLVNVSGEFTISKITLPLAYNGMMSVTLTKIPPTLTTEILIKEFE